MATPDVCYHNHPQCCLATDHLRYVADRSVRDWRRILAELGIEDHVIETVDEDAISRNCHDTREIAYQGYLKWHQTNPKKASFCILLQALNNVKRNDITEGLKNDLSHITPDHKILEKSNSFPSSVNYFVGREDEIERILTFSCNELKLKLMLIIGLPGMGKSELLNNSLNQVNSQETNLKIVRPLFPSNCGDSTWGLEDIAVCILEELQPGICVSKYRVAVLHKILTSIVEPTLLVLEIANLNFKEGSVIAFWTFIDRLIRFNNCHLKVIATSSKNPDLNQMQHLNIDQLFLKELDQDSSDKLLKHMNPNLSAGDCAKIFQFCGGNPFILRKLGAHIQNFTAPEKGLKDFFHALERNNEVDLQPFLRQTALRRDMKIVFNDLESDERETLVKLCCFHDIIPIDAINNLFGSNTAHIANHLWQNHCILDRGLCGTYYRMNEITRTCILDYAQSNSDLVEIMSNAWVTLINNHLQLVSQLDELFFCPKNLSRANVGRRAIEKYQQECKICEDGQCDCVISRILQVVFQNDKTIILRSIRHGLKNETTFYETVDVCLKTVHFLRNVVTPLELHGLYDLIFEKLNLKGDKIRMAVTMANLVFIKIYHRVCDEKDENISYLTKSIEFLEKLKRNLSTDAIEVLAYCYVNRGYLRGFYKHQFSNGNIDILKARSILQAIPQSYRATVAELSTYGYMGAIYYRNNMLMESIEERSIQIEGYKKHLGTHPYTAKSLHYQGQGYAKVKMYQNSANCCIISYQMYLKLKGEGVETMRILSTHGKTLISQGDIKHGITKLKQALTAGEQVLGEHDKIAWCYEQLADATEHVNGSKESVQELKNKACEMRKQFELLTFMGNRKTYSLQLSIDDVSRFNSICIEEEGNNYVQFAMLVMLIAFAWHVFITFYKSDCTPNYIV